MFSQVSHFVKSGKWSFEKCFLEFAGPEKPFFFSEFLFFSEVLLPEKSPLSCEFNHFV